jgi:hypothetical protein
LATWAAIGDALALGRTYDFEGSTIPGVERYYRRWAASVTPLLAVSKALTVKGAGYAWMQGRRAARVVAPSEAEF